MFDNNPLRRICLCIAFLCTGFAVAPVTGAEPISDGPWHYVLRKPPQGWELPDYDASTWREGNGGFGTVGTPGARVGTAWTTNNVWLRRTVELKALPTRPALLIHHDEDAEVFLNGTQVADFKGYVTDYKVVPLENAGREALRAGKNLLAVHCRQTGGGQFIDVHLVDADNVPKLPAPKRPTTPFKTELITQWGAKVTPDNAWQEYPRPQLVRQRWKNLNGQWDYALTKLEDDQPSKWAGKILVPFCLESKLSGVGRLLDQQEALWYHRTFEVKPTPERRTWLNFEAVDYQCRVWVNDVEVGQHQGGNVPFGFDVTRALKDGENHLVVRVEDATGGAQLRGKQHLDPHGIWYTRVSGIWQTVWLEEVAPRSIEDVKITTDIKAGSITIHPTFRGEPGPGAQLHVTVMDGTRILLQESDSAERLTVTLQNPKLWSPEQPQLYELKLRLTDADGKTLDEVESYAGLREVGQTRDSDGHLRFTLNGKILFHWGPLDQGWWPDGLLTPPSDQAMLSDVEFLKAAGFNMIRKHIKVEPRRYYYHCDRLGMLLWQDQVSGGANPKWTRLTPGPEDATWSDDDHAQFLKEFEAMVDALENHPSIVVWVPFNEAWGQHRTVEVGQWMVERDPTRLVNVASGGNFWPVGHVVDEHRYPHPGFPFQPERFQNFIKVMGEFGGHGWPIPGHLYDNNRRNWGYGGLPKSLEEYKDRYRESIRLLVELKAKGIAGGVYTQTTDVEEEINGLLTYDRKVPKIPAAELKEIHQALFTEIPMTKHQ